MSTVVNNEVLYRDGLETYLGNLLISNGVKSMPANRLSAWAYEWLESNYKFIDGADYVPINGEAIAISYNSNQRKFIYHNLYTFVLLCGINIPYYDWTFESERYKGKLIYGGRVHYWSGPYRGYVVEDYRPVSTMDDSAGDDMVVPM